MFGTDKFGFQPDIITTNMARAESASGWRGFALELIKIRLLDLVARAGQ
jgi:hypothetical protein